MVKLISLPFEYDENVYYTVVAVSKNATDSFELNITIMNGELQAKLQGWEEYKWMSRKNQQKWLN